MTECVYVSVCGCVCLPWPNTGPKWGQASHTLHSACLAGTASANQDRLGSRFQYRQHPNPPCNSHHSLGLWGIFSHLSVFPSFRFSFTPFLPQSFEFFFFFVFHHKCFSLFLTFASLILSLTTTATKAHKHNCLHFSNTTPSALLTFRVVKNPFSQCWAFDNVASVSLAEKNAEKSVRWSWDGVRGGKKTTKKGKQCSAP